MRPSGQMELPSFVGMRCGQGARGSARRRRARVFPACNTATTANQDYYCKQTLICPGMKCTGLFKNIGETKYIIDCRRDYCF